MIRSDKLTPWEFWDWGAFGTNPIRAWYENLSEEAQDKFDNILKDNSKIDSCRSWSAFKFMQGNLSAHGIWQFSFYENKVQHRVLGIFGKGKKAIILMGCTHKEDVYKPRNALKTAVDRAKTIRDGTGGVKPNARPIRTDL